MIDAAVLERASRELSTIDSIALMTTSSSTNLLARRIIDECLQNDIPVPTGLIIAREQREGRGRETRSWRSPRDAGIWSTALATVSSDRLPLLPLEVALCVSAFLEEHSALSPRIKWPNDVLVDGRKIAGILIEARSSSAGAHVAIGVGINLTGEAPHAGAITAEEAGAGGTDGGIDEAILAWTSAIDRMLTFRRSAEEIIRGWSARSALKTGDHVRSEIGGRTIEGSWLGIDPNGHARIATVEGERRIAAGEIFQLDSGAPS